MNRVRAQGRPKDPGKRHAILEAAGHLFLEQGFERTTMDAVAARAGVSKLTVYSHFADKEGLFRALITDKCGEHFEVREFESLAELGPETALSRIAQGFLSLLFHPDVVALHRVLVTTAAQDARMNRTFWETGPAATLAALSRLLMLFDAAGALRVPDPELAADQFFSMLKGADHLRVTLGIGDLPTPRRLQHYAAAAVETFLRAYTPERR
jgi:TetR/AcrR family transcriptional repressor of mexJK operon